MLRLRVIGILAPLGLLMLGGVALKGAAAERPTLAATGEAGSVLQIFYTPPVLVRAAERVVVPVDVVCATAGGSPCDAMVSLAARAGAEPWRRAEVPVAKGLRFDLTALASRALGSGRTGRVDFHLSAGDASGRTTELGSAGRPLSFYVVRDLPVLKVPAIPFGQVRRGRSVLSLPWGSGPTRAGLQPGIEGATTGPSSFDVGADGRLYLVDTLQEWIGVFERGRPVRRLPIEAMPNAAVAVGANGRVHVFDEKAGELRLQTIGVDGTALGAASFGRGVASQIRTVSSRPVVDQLPLGAWVRPRAVGPERTMSMGRPLDDGTELLRVVTQQGIRIARLRNDHVVDAVELRSEASFGDVALTEPDGRGGTVVVVHVWRDAPRPADQYQVIHIVGGRIIETFAAENLHFADTHPLSRFRLGPDGRLYQLTSTPSGMQIVSYRLKGVTR